MPIVSVTSNQARTFALGLEEPNCSFGKKSRQVIIRRRQKKIVIEVRNGFVRMK